MSANLRLPGRSLILLLIVFFCVGPTGCAMILRGDVQRVTVNTRPPQATVYYNGRTLKDGDAVNVRKTFKTPRFTTDAPAGLLTKSMDYSPDPYLLIDAALLFLWIIPGVVALAIDISSGSWRRLHDHQVVNVPRGYAKPQLAPPAPTRLTTPAPVEFDPLEEEARAQDPALENDTKSREKWSWDPD